MDVNRVLRNLVENGDAILGASETVHSMSSGEAKVVVVSRTMDDDHRARIDELSQENEIPLYEYPGGADQLGPAVGKPFLVSTMAITRFSDPDASALQRQGRVAE